MQPARPSRTALRVALRRAAHQIYDAKPLVLDDPVAVPLLGRTYAEELRRTPVRPDRPFSVALRAFLVARSRYAEDNLARAASRGVLQYVLLGAGLDTFAHRNPHPGLRVFEVDHPATQQWKRDLLDAHRIASPPSLTYAPVDFERQPLPEPLLDAGFDPRMPAFFAWLGVVPYLTEAAVFETLKFVSLVPRAEIVFDYANPPEQLDPAVRAAHEARAANVAAIGEPWLSYFDSTDLAARLAALGAAEVDDLGPVEIQIRIFRRPDPIPAGRGGHILWARWD
jgi:methyltransferase (TIGR00027 family)